MTRRSSPTDPITSGMAAATIDKREGKDRIKPGRDCHKVLATYGECDDLTDDEASYLTFLREGSGLFDSLRRRSSDLLEFGLIEDTGEIRRSRYQWGGPRMEHRITEEGRTALAMLALGRTWYARPDDLDE